MGEESTARKAGWTYARSGVNRSEVASALAELIRAARYDPPSSHGRPVEAPGHYAGMIRIGRETVAITTDTVGTKVLLAEELHRWEEVGEDIVGVNVNDLAAVGARTAGLVDVILCARPRPAEFRAIGRGIGRGLRAAECALLGGETAVVPGIVDGIDLGGTAFGFFPGKRTPITGSAGATGGCPSGNSLERPPRQRVHPRPTVAPEGFGGPPTAPSRRSRAGRARIAASDPDLHAGGRRGRRRFGGPWTRPPLGRGPPQSGSAPYGGRVRFRPMAHPADAVRLAAGARRDLGRGDVPDLQYGDRASRSWCGRTGSP